jgi:hypothetical protein
LRAVERLNLALFVNGKYNGVRGRIDIEPDDIALEKPSLWPELP